jgi:hypothetical protein
MDSSDLRPWQARKIRRQLESALSYLTRLKRRMELRGFPPNEPLYLAATQAQNGLQSLLVQLHYLSCESGVGRSRDDDRWRSGPRAR